MSEIQAELPPLEERPLVTFALFAYNQEKYIREAIEGAFAQTYEPLEIILSDDCSTDRTFEIMEEMAAGYRGSHRVSCNRNPLNLGLIDHVNRINSLAKGDLIVAAAGDDVSVPERTAEHALAYMSKKGQVHSIHSSVMKIDGDGQPIELWMPPILRVGNAPEQLALNFGAIIGASHSWSRSVVSQFGPLRYRNSYEDLVICFRSSLLGGISYIDKPLVRYRYGIGISANHGKTVVTKRDAVVKAIRGYGMIFDTLRQREVDCKKIGRIDLLRPIRSVKFKVGLKVAFNRVKLLFAR